LASNPLLEKPKPLLDLPLSNPNFKLCSGNSPQLLPAHLPNPLHRSLQVYPRLPALVVVIPAERRQEILRREQQRRTAVEQVVDEKG